MKLNQKLLDASKKALFDYLGLSEDETLMILTDEKLNKIGKHLHEAAKDCCMEVFYVEMKSREINGEEPPIQIAEMMKNVDVVIAPLYRSITHTDARRNASRLGVCVATMPNISEDTMIRCLSAKTDKIISTTNLIAERMKGIKEIRVTTKLGTDVTMPVKDRKIIASTGVLKKIGESGNLPSGEVFLAPIEGETNGTVIFDGSFAGIGLLEEPITIKIEKGYAVSIEGGEQAKQLEEMMKKVGLDAFAVGEFGIGTNYKAKLTGTILEDEKVFGTIHIAFGNNVTMGGTIKIHSHLDGLVKKPTVYFDDEMIMDKGKLVIK